MTVSPLVGPLKPVELDTGKGGTVKDITDGAVVPVASILVIDTIPLEIPDTPVDPRVEVAFVNGKGGTLDRDNGAVTLCPVPVPNDGNVEFEDTGSSEDLLPTPVPVTYVGVAVIEEFPAGDRAVVDGKRLVKLVLTPELVGPEVGALRVDEFPAEDGKIEAVLDAVPAAPLDVASGTLSVGLGTRVEEKLESGNGAEEK